MTTSVSCLVTVFIVTQQNQGSQRIASTNFHQIRTQIAAARTGAFHTFNINFFLHIGSSLILQFKYTLRHIKCIYNLLSSKL
ncbi:hypothetical protein MTR_1g016930 [Medicago truncatula]|uniref:Uncharacterized protein n=1 Tax=Medicago truncatula TaxID=3880 RepID=A0A072VDT7_MEDTR|nr:hypothetical protein MTR_1g016930 [Medicago truncatula]